MTKEKIVEYLQTLGTHEANEAISLITRLVEETGDVFKVVLDDGNVDNKPEEANLQEWWDNQPTKYIFEGTHLGRKLNMLEHDGIKVGQKYTDDKGDRQVMYFMDMYEYSGSKDIRIVLENNRHTSIEAVLRDIDASARHT